MKFILRLAINMVALYVAVIALKAINGITFQANWQWINLLWLSFFTAVLGETAFFAIIDPQELYLMGEPVFWSPMVVYSVGFFMFWSLTALTAGLVVVVWVAEATGAVVVVVIEVGLVAAGELEVGDWLLHPMITKAHTSRIDRETIKPFIFPPISGPF